MLRGIHKASNNWIGKIVMGSVMSLLAISFGIWGVGDIFRGFGQSTLATVGSTEIGIEQFRQIYNERLQQLGAQFGRPILPEQARALQLDRQILQQVIGDAALDERARQLGLGISDAAIAEQIKAMPMFKGANGSFDTNVFDMRIRSAGYTEQRFVAEQRRQIMRQHLTGSVTHITPVPKTFMEALNRYQNERRAVEFVTLDGAQAGTIPDPTPDQLSKYFEQNKAEFRAPEYRRLVVVRLTPTDVAKWITVSDADARKMYDQNRSRFVTPGKRHIEQLFYLNPDDAKKAYDRIKAGTSFDAIVAERKLSKNDYDLGLVDKATLSSSVRGPAFTEAAFSTPEGGVSEPVKTGLGTAIVHVVKVEPDSVKSFAEAEPEIKQSIVKERTRDELQNKHDKIEDERAGGSTLEQAAQKVGLSMDVFDAIDRTGKDPSGAKVANLPTETDVLTPAFNAEVGSDADPIELRGDGGYIWYDVTKITPAHDRPLTEVKDTVTARWHDDQVAERLRTKATALVDKLKAGAKLADVAAGDGLTVQNAKDLRRGQAADGLPVPAINAVFATAKGAPGSAEGTNETQRVVFRVTDVTVPPITAGPEEKRLQDAVANAIGQDLLGEYIAEVERELGTSINAAALRRATGAPDAGDNGVL
jgi:peptidyl-prolyl cis-trans isomerase D